MLYDTASDYSLRLENTVIRYGEEPVFVYRVTDSRILMFRLSDRYEFEARFDDPLINIKPVPLGYINTDRRGAVYAVRLPTRRYKQGLCRQNVKAVDNSINVLDHYSDLGNTIKNEFHSLRDAMAFSLERELPSAFDRKFAVMWDGSVYKLLYKTEEIGEIDTNGFTLNDKHSFLARFISHELTEHIERI